jgi:hypothetical protein
MRLRVAVFSVLGLAAVASAIVVSTRSEEALGALDVPVDRARDSAMSFLACDDEGVWLLLTERRPADVDRQSERSSLVRAGRDGSWVERAIGAGRIAAGSLGGDGSVWLLVHRGPPGPGMETKLLTRDHGESERREVPVPEDAAGVAFRTRLEGWAWTPSVLFRTADGGASWSTVDVTPWLLGTAWSHVRPRLDASGRLWVALRGTEGREGSGVLAVFRPGQDRRDVREWHGVTVDGVGLAESFAVVASQPLRGGSARLERVGENGDHATLLDVDDETPIRLLARGQVVMLETAGGEWPVSFFGLLRTREHLSVDSGATWQTEDTTGLRVSDACVAASGRWRVSNTLRRLWFSPYPSR